MTIQTDESTIRSCGAGLYAVKVDLSFSICWDGILHCAHNSTERFSMVRDCLVMLFASRYFAKCLFFNLSVLGSVRIIKFLK